MNHFDLLAGRQLPYWLQNMPSFHGIEVSVLTQSDVGRLPEYPHPNGTKSSFQPRASPGTTGHQSPQEAPVDEVLAGSVEEESTVSVYIPSVPGLDQPIFPHLLIMALTFRKAHNFGSTILSSKIQLRLVTCFSSFT